LTKPVFQFIITPRGCLEETMPAETVAELTERLYKVHKFAPSQIGRQRLYQGRVERIKMPVWTDTGETLQLRGSVTRGGDIQFSLVTGTQVIRKWHSHAGHYNPDGELVDGPHKHYPTSEYPQAKCAYSTGDDIPTDNFEEALSAFLEECNIELLWPFREV